MWKLKRELRRLSMQVTQIPWFVFGSMLRPIYDLQKQKYIKLTPGTRPMRDDMALLLIYQPKGLLASTLHTLEHLHAKGFSTLVVSNAPIAPADLETLKAHAHLIMERPNYGYDFGGYRDGILHLMGGQTRPKRVLVLNDSIWFPLMDDCDLIERVRAADKDLYGFVLNERPDEPHRTHLQSYFFCFGERLVGHPDFLRYWKRLFVSSNKNLVIRRCEMRMTEAFRKLGHSIGYRHIFADVVAALKTLDVADLKRIVPYQMQIDISNTGKLRSALSDIDDPERWRDRVLELADEGRMGKYFLIAHPLILLGKLGCPMLKKDRQPMYQLQRAELFACGFGARLAPEVRDEMESQDKA